MGYFLDRSRKSGDVESQSTNPVRLTIILLVALSMGMLRSNAQTFLSNASIFSMYNPADTVGLDESQLDRLPATYRLSADLQDASVKSITVWMGMETGSKDLLDQNFDLTTSTTFENGTAVTVDGTSFSIDMGEFTGLSEFEIRVLGLNSMGGVLHQLDLSYPEN